MLQPIYFSNSLFYSLVYSLLSFIILFCLLQYHSNGISPLFIFIVSEAAVCGEAEELEMPTERYIQDLQQALTGVENSTNYSFSLTPSPPDSSSAVTLAYEKVQRDISVSTLIARISDVCLFILTICQSGQQVMPTSDFQ